MPGYPFSQGVVVRGVADKMAGADLGLRLVHTRPLFCRVTEIADPTPDIRVVRLTIAVGGSFRFAAGQYAMLAFGEHRPRPFSMAGRPDDAFLEFHVRHGSAVGAGAGAHAAARLRRGDGVWVEGPFGNAFLCERHAGPLLGVAGGTGIAPLLSIAATALARQPQRTVRLYVGVRDETELYFAAQLTRLAERYPGFQWTATLAKPSTPSGWRTGMVTDALANDLGLVKGVTGSPGDSRTNSCTGVSVTGGKAYIAGPPPMVAAAAGLLRAAGMADSDIHADDFRLSADPRRFAGAVHCSIGRAEILPGGGEDVA